MQAINVVVPRSAFMPVFLGPAILSAAAAVFSGGDWRPIGGGLLYLTGCVGVTAFYNVPLNKRLARAEPDSDAGAALGALPAAMGAAGSHPHTDFDDERNSAGIIR